MKDQEKDGRELLRLSYGNSWTEVAMEQVLVLIPNPEMIRVPGAPDGIAGMISREGSLLPVYGTGRDGAKPPECVVLIRDEDGRTYGVAADEIAEGGEG